MAHQPLAYAACPTGSDTGVVACWVRRDYLTRFEATISEPLPAELVVLAAKLFH